MFEIGRLCVKIAGRDAGKKCVVIDTIDKNSVLIDGETRRRKCNLSHLEPLDKIITIKKNISHEEIKNEFEKLGLKVLDTKSKQKAIKPRAKRKTPEQLRSQKEERRKLRDIFKKKREEKKQDEKLESRVETVNVEKPEPKTEIRISS